MSTLREDIATAKREAIQRYASIAKVLDAECVTTQEKSMSDALNRQEGGGHYKQFKIQPIEYITANGLGYMEGNVVKYISRHKFKNKAEDIRKIIHYCELILELEYGEGDVGST